MNWTSKQIKCQCQTFSLGQHLIQFFFIMQTSYIITPLEAIQMLGKAVEGGRVSDSLKKVLQRYTVQRH